MSERATRVLIALVGVAAAWIGAAALAAAGRSGSAEFERLSNRGLPVETDRLKPFDREELAVASVTELRFMAERQGVRFYRAATAGGAECLVTTNVRAGYERIGTLGCPVRFGRDHPIADLTAYSQGLDDAYPEVRAVAGLAADAVASVGVRSPDGRIRWFAVADNVYAGRPERGLRAAALLARDDDGGIVYTAAIGGRTLREEYAVSQ